MSTNGKEPLIAFEVWKVQLRTDCELQGKILAFGALGDDVLELYGKPDLTRA